LRADANATEDPVPPLTRPGAVPGANAEGPGAASNIIDGTAIARRIRDEIAKDVAVLHARGLIPGLAVVLVGEDPASQVYVRAKGRACEEAGMKSVTIRLPADTTEEQLLFQVRALNVDPTMHGILVQMPLPPQINPDVVIRAVDPRKDVDGFHPTNVGKLLIGERDGFAPCTPAGVQELLLQSGVQTAGKECVLIGRSNIVGKPMAALMIQDRIGANATVTVCHRHTRDLAFHTRRAEILIVAAGRAHVVTGDMVRPGAVVIDVGINRVEDATMAKGYRLVGDVDFDAVRQVASLITPVPGGVGPMTIAMLLKNTVRAAAQLVPAAGDPGA
jgi:methylenetetrahydrofolate dehydrogenase (NADP+)/methenyltetrahydrofolate cyclohydrolase